MRQSVGVCRQVCSVVSAGSDACYVRTPYDDKSTKEIAGLLVRVQSEELLPSSERWWLVFTLRYPRITPGFVRGLSVAEDLRQVGRADTPDLPAEVAVLCHRRLGMAELAGRLPGGRCAR